MEFFVFFKKINLQRSLSSHPFVIAKWSDHRWNRILDKIKLNIVRGILWRQIFQVFLLFTKKFHDFDLSHACMWDLHVLIKFDTRSIRNVFSTRSKSVNRLDYDFNYVSFLVISLILLSCIIGKNMYKQGILCIYHQQVLKAVTSFLSSNKVTS